MKYSFKTVWITHEDEEIIRRGDKMIKREIVTSYRRIFDIKEVAPVFTEHEQLIIDHNLPGNRVVCWSVSDNGEGVTKHFAVSSVDYNTLKALLIATDGRLQKCTIK